MKMSRIGFLGKVDYFFGEKKCVSGSAHATLTHCSRHAHALLTYPLTQSQQDARRATQIDLDDFYYG